MKSTKFMAFILVTALSLLTVACGDDGSNGSVSCENNCDDLVETKLDSVKTVDDLLACLEKNDGSVAWVSDDSVFVICMNRKWEKYENLKVYGAEGELPNCSEKRDSEYAYIVDKKEIKVCKDERWYEADEKNAFSSSSSKGKSGSSSSLIDEDELLYATNSSSNEKIISSSSLYDPDTPIVIPTQNNAGIIVSADLGSRPTAYTMRFTGGFDIDITDASLDTLETRDQIQFTKIAYAVGKGNDINNMTVVNVAVQSNPIVFPSKSINLNSQLSAFVHIDMYDPGFNNECGIYSLIVTVYASDDPVNAPDKFARTEVIPFDRETAQFCHTGSEPVEQGVP